MDFQPRIESVLVDLNAPEQRLYDAISSVDVINPLTKSAVYLHEGCSSMPCLAKTLIEGPEKYIKSVFADNELLEDKEYRTIMEQILKMIEKDKYSSIRDMRNTTPDPKLWGILTAFLEKEELKEYGEEYLADKNNVKDSKLDQLDMVINTKLTSANGYVMKKRHMVIFAHYIATCNYIYEHFRTVCEENTKIFLATGENTKQEIDQSIDEFKQTCKEDNCDSIMICSDICREGKNMQECQVLINYDLPFSPAIMQQRIGRIDRNGQQNTPLAYHLEDKVGILKPELHLGMFQDSVLYTTYFASEDEATMDFRYFPKGIGDCMESYSWSDNIERVVLKNDSGYDITFNSEKIEPGETKVFTPEKHKQGLLSPDSYNGKSIIGTWLKENSNNSDDKEDK